MCLILGDNIFYGDSFSKLLSDTKETVEQKNAVIFTFPVKNPSDYGVAKIKK